MMTSKGLIFWIGSGNEGQTALQLTKKAYGPKFVELLLASGAID